MVRIREYRLEDFEELWRLDQSCFAPGIAYSRFELMHYIRRRNAFTLVVEEDTAQSAPFIAAFLVAEWRALRARDSEAEPQRKVGHIITLDVHSRVRRTGVGSRLMDEAERRLQQAGCDTVYLETAVNNHPAIAFYKRLGYSVLKTIPRYYEGSLDALLMGKVLSENCRPG
ncbi:MAG: GNAT family N-acetyltransferase [Terriglobales bacterium]